jgi:membrane protein YqaA with SNARE-associated domain
MDLILDASTLAQLGGLALAAFVAGTLAPMQSEIVFAALAYAQTAPMWVLLLVASVANTLGSVVNWFIGRFIEWFRARPWFPVSDSQLSRAQDWWARWGVWSLLMSWAPGGGWITVISGVMRTPLWLFTLIVAIAKTGRYIVFAWLLTFF